LGRGLGTLGEAFGLGFCNYTQKWVCCGLLHKTGFDVFNVWIWDLGWELWYFKNGFGVFMILGLGIGLGSGRSFNVPPIRFIV
jgi:hypothetical protein